MFTVDRRYQGNVYPIAMLYVDSLHERYTFDEIVVQATDAQDWLVFPAGAGQATFQGAALPLSGAEFLTAVTGTLTIIVTARLAVGLTVLSLQSVTRTLPGQGLALSGVGLMGQPGQVGRDLTPLIQVQYFPVEGVAWPSTNRTRSGLPTMTR